MISKAVIGERENETTDRDGCELLGGRGVGECLPVDMQGVACRPRKLVVWNGMSIKFWQKV